MDTQQPRDTDGMVGIIPVEERADYLTTWDNMAALQGLSDSLNLIAQYPATHPDGQELRAYLDWVGYTLWDIADRIGDSITT